MTALTAKDLIKDAQPVYSHPEETVLNAVKKMNQHNIGSIPIVSQNNTLQGIFTERDLVKLIADKGPQALNDKIEEHMTRKPITALPQEPLPSIAHKMLEHGVRHIPVTDEQGHLLGVISIRRILRHLLAANEWP